METISNSHKIPHTHHLQETKTRKETSPDTTQLTSTNIDILTLTTSPPMKIGFKQSPTPTHIDMGWRQPTNIAHQCKNTDILFYFSL